MNPLEESRGDFLLQPTCGSQVLDMDDDCVTFDVDVDEGTSEPRTAVDDVSSPLSLLEDLKKRFAGFVTPSTTEDQALTYDQVMAHSAMATKRFNEEKQQEEEFHEREREEQRLSPSAIFEVTEDRPRRNSANSDEEYSQHFFLEHARRSM